MNDESAQVLLVEDNGDHAELIQSCLAYGCAIADIAWVKNGHAALTYLRDVAEPPRLVLLDLRLPRLDGLEVLAQLREEPLLRAIPVLVLTTSAREQDVERAYRLGANGYVVKPESLDELRATLNDVVAFWIHRNRAPRRVA